MKKCIVFLLSFYLVSSSVFCQDLSNSLDYSKVINQLLLVHNSFYRIQNTSESQSKDLFKIKNEELVKINSNLNKAKVILDRLVIQFPKDSTITDIKQNIGLYYKCVESFSTSAWQERPMYMVMNTLIFERLELYCSKLK